MVVALHPLTLSNFWLAKIVIVKIVLRKIADRLAVLVGHDYIEDH